MTYVLGIRTVLLYTALMSQIIPAAAPFLRSNQAIPRLQFAIVEYERTGRNFFPPLALRPNAGHGLLILDVSRSHTMTHHSR
jgi:hypothetical protein